MDNMIKTAEPQPAWFIKSMSRDQLRDYIRENLTRKWGPLNDKQYRMQSSVDSAKRGYEQALRWLQDSTAKLSGAANKGHAYRQFVYDKSIKDTRGLELQKLLKKYNDIGGRADYLEKQFNNPDYISRVASRYRNLANAKYNKGLVKLLSTLRTAGKWSLPGIAAALTYTGVQAARSKGDNQ